MRAKALVGLCVANGAAVVLVWWAGLDVSSLDRSGALVNAAGRLTGLLGTYLVLVQLLLRTHVPWLVTAFGKDALKVTHSRNAYLAFALLGVHGVLQPIGYALEHRVDLFRELGDLVVYYDGVLLSVFALVLLGGLTVLSLEGIRHRIAWPLWRALHLFTYVAVALSVPHQLATGSDFVDAPLAVAYWTALLAVVATAVGAAALPRLWSGALSRIRAGQARERPRAVTAGLAAAVVGMYLIGTVRLAPAPDGPMVLPAATATPAVAPSVPSSTNAARSSAGPAANIVAGIDGDAIEMPYGEVQVRVFLGPAGIEDIKMIVKPSATRRSRYMAEAADPWLRKRALEAQSARFDVLSGATYTSLAYMRSLDSALRAAAAEPR